MKPRLTQVEQRRQDADATKQKICTVLGWTEDQYAFYQYNTGLAYIAVYMDTDEAGADNLGRSRMFWNWWKNHWTSRDDTFLSYNIKPALSTNHLEELYFNMHDAATLAAAIYPSGVIMKESVTEIINQLFNPEMKHHD